LLNPTYLSVTSLLEGDDGDTFFLERQCEEVNHRPRQWRLCKQEPPPTTEALVDGILIVKLM